MKHIIQKSLLRDIENIAIKKQNFIVNRDCVKTIRTFFSSIKAEQWVGKTLDEFRIYLINLLEISAALYNVIIEEFIFDLSTQEVPCHNSDYSIEINSGDLITVDLLFKSNGQYWDIAIPFSIGNNIINHILMDKSRKVIKRAIENSKTLSVKKICNSVKLTAIEEGLQLLENCGGHGIGFNPHQLPSFIYSKDNLDDYYLSVGDCFTIEPVMSLDGRWCHFEVMILVTDEGIENIFNFF